MLLLVTELAVIRFRQIVVGWPWPIIAIGIKHVVSLFATSKFNTMLTYIIANTTECLPLMQNLMGILHSHLRVSLDSG